jgi:DNA repair protein RadD
MITLRQNQKIPINKAIDFFKAKNTKPSLIVLPTAWGKSILTAFVSKSTSEPLLVIQPSKELLEQNIAKYHLLCDDVINNAGIYSASFGKKQMNKITYATIGSIKNIGSTFKEFGIKKLLIDEAHLYPREADSMLGKFLKDSEITHVLGITATPIKLQSNTDVEGNRFSKLQMLTSRSGKGNFFKEIIHVGQVKEMVELGFWSKLNYQSNSFDDSNLVFNSAKSEYTEESVELSYRSNDIKGKIIEALDNNKDRNHILAFLPSVSDAIEMSKKYPKSGVVYGKQDKKERENTINLFRSGQIRVLFNVRVLSVGFDYTKIDCEILGISTASIALYYQIIGRATRIDIEKQNALIIDFGGNLDRFGRVEDIVFEKVGRLWRMFGTDGKLLSGMPIHEIGSITRESLKKDINSPKIEKQIRLPRLIEVMPFGKYEGVKIIEIPIDYRLWLLKNFDRNSNNADLIFSFEQSLIIETA